MKNYSKDFQNQNKESSKDFHNKDFHNKDVQIQNKEDTYVYKNYVYKIIGMRFEKYVVNELDEELKKEGIVNKYEGLKKNQEHEEADFYSNNKIVRYENDRHILILENANSNSKNIFYELQLSLEGNKVIIVFKKVSSPVYVYQIINKVEISLSVKYFAKNYNIYLNRPDYNIYINDKKPINNMVFQVYSNTYFINMEFFNVFPIKIKRKVWIYYGDDNIIVNMINFLKDATLFDSSKFAELPDKIYEDIIIIDRRYNPNDIFGRISGDCEFILVNFSKISKNNEKPSIPTHPSLIYKKKDLLTPDNIIR